MIVPLAIIIILVLVGRAAMAEEKDAKLIGLLVEAFSDWQGDQSERLVLIADGQVFTFRGESDHGISVPFGEILRALSRKGLRFGQVTNIVHNHVWPDGFSETDKELEKALRKLGFVGEFQVFYPDVRRIKTMKRSLI